MENKKTKTVIQIAFAQEPPAPSKEKRATLADKVDCAIGYVEADHRREEALKFLRDVLKKLETAKKPSATCCALKDKVKVALQDWGHFALGEDPSDA